MSLVTAIADAITQVESGGNPNALSFRNNNPGNLVSWGSLPISQGFAVFPTLAAGRAALENQIQININRGLTLYEFFAGKPGVYAGYASSGSSAKNNPVAYAQTVAAAVGIDPNTPLNALGSTPVTPTPAIDPTTGEVVDSTSDINSDPSQSGVIDWTTIGLVGLGAFVLWYLWDEFLG